MMRVSRVWVVAGMLALASTAPAAAEEQWVVVIGVAKHQNPDEKLRDLLFPGQDARRVRATIQERADVPANHILELTDEAGAEYAPTLANLRRHVPAFLAKAQPGDRVLVFYSGHGTNFDGTLYLVPRDFDRKNLRETLLSIGEMKQWLGRCQAEKFLVLDCCHAGEDGATAAALAKGFDADPLPGVLVLASCRANEKSLEWPAKKLGLFTYWLCHALEGGASTRFGEVTFDAVNKYVHERVPKTSSSLFNRAQTPTTYGKKEGDPTVLKLKPEPPEMVARRLAASLEVEILHGKLRKVCVPEFFLPQGRADEQLARANLPKILADLVRDELTRRSAGRFAVVAGPETNALLKDLKVETIREPNELGKLAKSSVDGVVFGTVRKARFAFNVSCELIGTDEGGSLGKADGVIPLRPELLGDVGDSFNNVRVPEGRPHSDATIADTQENVRRAHPLLDKAFPFSIEVWVGGKKRDWSVLHPSTPEGVTELILPVKEGEEFEVHVRNRTAKRIAMPLLLDGVNSLGQKRELLADARKWVLEPNPEPKPAHVIPGWYLPKGPVDNERKQAFDTVKFKFVDLTQSVAARDKFGVGLGLITAAFYEESDRTIAVGEGQRLLPQNLQTLDFRTGRCLGVVHIRYAEEKPK